MLRRPRPSGDGGDAGGGAGTATTVGASASDGQADASLVRVLGVFPDCVLSKLNSDGPAFASIMKRLIADYCGVSYEAAFAEWVADLEAAAAAVAAAEAEYSAAAAQQGSVSF